MDNQELRKPRVRLIDEIRGADVILMLIFHAYYDLVYIFGVRPPRGVAVFMAHLQPVIAMTFIVLAGISCRFSRDNRRRGIRVLCLGLALSAVTLFAIPSEAIYFGILHFMGAAMILFRLLGPLLDKPEPVPGFLTSLLLFLVLYNLPNGTVGFARLVTIPLPASWYAGHALLPLGFGGMGSDYFPLLPWIFLFFAGSYLGVLIERGVFPTFVYRSVCPPLGWLGQKTLWVYMLHQPVIYGVLWLVFARQ